MSLTNEERNKLIHTLKNLTAENTEEIVRLFNKYNYSWCKKEITELFQTIIYFINYKNSNFMHHLAQENNIELFERLVEKGAVFSNQDQKGSTPLHVAINFNSEEVVEFILQQDVKICQKQNYSSPVKNKSNRISFSSRFFQYSTSDLYSDSDLKLGSDKSHYPLEMERKNNADQTPLDYCLKNSQGPVFKQLYNYSAHYWSGVLKNIVSPKKDNKKWPYWYESSVLPEYDWISLSTGQIITVNKNKIIENRFCSGFLISDTYLMTAGHCVSDVCSDIQQGTNNIGISFGYEYDSQGKLPKPEKVYRVNRVADAGICLGVDYAIYELFPSTDLRLFPKPNLNFKEIYIKENIVIAHHPDGKPKKISLGEIVDVNSTSGTISYNADTLGGSSGAPVASIKDRSVLGVHILGGAISNTAISIKKIAEKSSVLTSVGLFKSPVSSPESTKTHEKDINKANFSPPVERKKLKRRV